jgi:hypothetical protein
MTLQEKKIKATDLNIELGKMQTALQTKTEEYKNLMNEIIKESKQAPLIEE